MRPTLADVIAKLAALDHATPQALAEVLSANVSFDDVRPFIRFDGESYVRALVFRNERVELRLLCWRPGQSSSLHGHGDSSCAFRVIRGAASESVVGERDRVWSPGSVVLELGPRVHQLRNSGDDPLLTLHAYSPPLPVDAPSSPRGRQIVIVGGGFSGIAAAYHLLRRGDPDLRIHIVEMGPFLGRGIAYGVESEIFRLNVPASKMSIDPERPDDFVRFAEAEAEPNAFLGRALYARYVTARFASAIRESRSKLRLWRDEVVALSESDVTLRSGRRLPAEAVVLATGLTPRLTHPDWHPGVVDAWDECALATLPRAGRLLLLGAGLSALDVVAFLEAHHFEGSITVVSRRGLLPFAHEAAFHRASPLSAADAAAAPTELRALMRWVREKLGEAPDLPWQRGVDRLRPHVGSLFGRLSAPDRARFVRHVRPYWDVIRHRAPVDALARVEALQASGRLERLAGRVTILEGGPGVRVEIAERSGARRSETFDAVVRCIGPALSAAEGETPLLRSLIASGLARITADGLGPETLANGRLVDREGTARARIFALGAVRRASHWETTSVPDIAVQAQETARDVLARA